MTTIVIEEMFIPDHEMGLEDTKKIKYTFFRKLWSCFCHLLLYYITVDVQAVRTASHQSCLSQRCVYWGVGGVVLPGE